jgi:glycosidase
MDFVPNHTSIKHEWFNKSVNNYGKYKNYYIWHKGRVNNTQPPNNWTSVFGGPAWTYNKERDLWYFHQFDYRQPDLNYNNLKVETEMKVSYFMFIKQNNIYVYFKIYVHIFCFYLLSNNKFLIIIILIYHKYI